VVVTAVELRKSFGDTQALAGASLAARSGEIHAIVGENGSGKSTLIKILAGIYGPDSGHTEVLGRSSAGMSPADILDLGLATVFQEVLVAEGASVADNIFAGYDGTFRRRVSRGEKLQRTGSLLSQLTGHDVDPTVPAGSLSLGDRQWVTIARAMARAPRVLILDESTSALDLSGTASLLRELERLKEEGVCVILVTHRIAELSVFADRATVLRDGATTTTLEKSQISEQSLLELMGGRAPAAKGHAASTRPVNPEPGEALVDASAIKLAADAEPIELTLRAGEIVGLAGLEGHGQGDLIEVLAGIRRPVAGEIRTRLPAAADGKSRRGGIAYVSGDRKRVGVFPEMSILENFGLPTYRAHTTAGMIRWRDVRGALERFREQLGLRMGKPRASIGSLSGGNQQKVLIARWLAAEPRVLLLDDPTRGVDAATKSDLHGRFRQFAREEGMGIILLSTEIEELLEVCDRILVMRKGSVAAELRGDAGEDKILASMFGVEGIDDVLAAEREATGSKETS